MFSKERLSGDSRGAMMEADLSRSAVSIVALVCIASELMISLVALKRH